MDVTQVLPLVKASLGISSTVRDTYLTAKINSIIQELEDQNGLILDGSNSYHLMFVVDYSVWRYLSRDSSGGMPRHLKWRLNNLIIHVGANSLDVDSILNVDALPVNPDSKTVYILSTDNSKQMYLSGVWKTVNLVNGSWAVVA